MTPLTTKQYALLCYIHDYPHDHDGRWPSMMEIAYYFGVRRESIYQRIRVLEKMGYVTYHQRQPLQVNFMPGMGEIKRAA